MISLADIDSQRVRTIVGDYMICKRCGVVDRERSRMVVDSPCPACKKPAGVARLYFPINVPILVDLIQQAYHSDGPINREPGPQAQAIGPILFFCTLREVLLNHFLVTLLRAESVRSELIEKLFSDNKLASQKFTSLFCSVTGKKWMDAIEEASAKDEIAYGLVSDLMQRAAQIRNQFMHEGSGWAATRELATECINSLPALLQLFVTLHNINVRPHLETDTPE